MFMATLPKRLRPMLATPIDAPFHRRGWSYEEKYDGYRIVAFKEGRRVRLVTRNEKDRTGDFPDIAAAVAKLTAPTLVLDGEVVIFDDEGVSRFQLLQRRGIGEPTSAPVYVVFDCVFARGDDLRNRPLSARREALEREVPARSKWLRRARCLAKNGMKAFERARREHLEGLIAKCDASVYREGVRSDQWLKVKVRREDEFVIGGYTAPRGHRQGFGALLVGVFDDKGALRYAGKVGTGYSERTIASLMARFPPLLRAQSPFAERVREKWVTWLEPRLVAQVAYAEFTADGKVRQSAFLGLRDDKRAREVRRPGAG
jgi:bifunctional non-homologous end joining protein LigD